MVEAQTIIKIPLNVIFHHTTAPRSFDIHEMKTEFGRWGDEKNNKTTSPAF
jgi:hypothetical protein